MAQPDLTDTTRLQQLYARRVAAQTASGAGTDPHLPLEAILAVVRREGTEAERLARLEHVMSCAACHREYQWLTAVDQAALEADSESRHVRRRPWWQGAPLAIAASVLAVVGLTLALQHRLQNAPEVERGGAAGDITLVSPPAGVSVGGPLTFVWHPVARASRYVLEIQRRDGSVAYTDTTSDTTAILTDPARVLTDTEYRWWVRETTDGSEPRSSALRKLQLPQH